MDDRFYATVRTLGRVEFGAMQPSERNLVMSSWIRGMTDAQGRGERSNSPHRGAYLAANGTKVERLMEHATVLVARDAECAALAYAWLAYEGDVLLWVCTKSGYRKCGLARLLLSGATHLRFYKFRSRKDALLERAGLEFMAPHRKSA